MRSAALPRADLGSFAVVRKLARVLRSLALALLAAPSLGAPAFQAVEAGALARRRAQLESASAEWFTLGFEQVQCELEHDVGRALETARSLVDASQRSGDVATQRTACALALLALGMRDGPAAAFEQRAWVAAVEAGLAPDAPQELRTNYFNARSRLACLADDAAAELEHAAAGIEVVARGGAQRQRLRNVICMHHVIDDLRSTVEDDLRGELRELAQAPALAPWRAWLAMHEYLHERSDHTREEKLARIERADALALELGDRRTHLRVVLERARVQHEGGDPLGALEWVARAREEARSAGFIDMLGACLQLELELALEAGALERVDAALALAGELVEGRGMPVLDGSLLECRFQLAVARRDAAAVLELTDDMEAHRAALGERYAAYGELQERFLSAQRERLEAQRAEREALERAQRSRDDVVRGVGLGIAGALLLVVAIALRSRSKQLAVNRRLELEIERAERESRARAELEERMRQLERSDSLGLLASGIAHDFNNLMVGVLGNADLLRGGESDPTRQRWIDAIAAAGERAARLCAQLQSYADGEPTELVALEPAALAASFLPALEAAVGTAVALELRAPATAQIQGSRAELEQALLNLVVNARDAGARRIELVVEDLRLSDEQPQRIAELLGVPGVRVRGAPSAGDWVRIEVRDDGEGMNAELLERIFDPFFTTRFPGRGLGLAVVFGVVRRHGALVAVASQPGVGSRFVLAFRAQATELVERELQPQPAPRAASGGALNVLVVDDEPQVREVLARTLAASGHRVATAQDLDGALEHAAQLDALGGPLVALADLTLPGDDGREVVRRLRAAHPRMALVLMSGHAAAHLEQVARELQVEAWLSKPPGASALERTLQTAVVARLGAAV
jgi:signal transduction histidine kinase/ActR/RegA family two-component response regulator